MADIGKLQVRVGADASEFTQGMARISQDLKRVQGEFDRWTSGLRSSAAKLKDVGMSLSAAISLPLAGLAGAAIKVRADFDALERGMTAVTGSAAKASAEMAKLQETAKLPGLGFREAVQGSINLQAAGFSAQQSRESLEAFGNALAMVGKGKAELEGVVLGLQKMASTGKITAEAINMIAERAPQVRVAMKAAFGTADTEDLQKMGISAEQFVAKLTAELGKLPKATGGLKNAWENLRDSWDQALNQMGKTLEPFAAKAAEHLDNLAQKAGNVAKAYQDLAPWQQKVALGVGGVAIGGPAGILLLGTLAEKALALAVALKMLAPVAKGVAALIAGIGAAVAYAVAAIVASAPAVVIGGAIVGAAALVYAARHVGPDVSKHERMDVKGRARRTAQYMSDEAEEALKLSEEQAKHNAEIKRNNELLTDEEKARRKAAIAAVTHKKALEELSLAEIFNTEVGRRMRSEQENLIQAGYDAMFRKQKVELAELVPATLDWSKALAGLPFHSVRNLLDYLNPAWFNLNSSIERSKQLIESLKPAALKLKEAFEGLGLKDPSEFAKKGGEAAELYNRIAAAKAKGETYNGVTINDKMLAEAKKKATEAGTYGAPAAAPKWVQDTRQTFSSLYNDLNKNLADIIVSGGKFGDMMKKSFETAEKALLRLAFSEGFKAFGKQMLKLLGNFEGLKGALKNIPGLGKVFGGAASAASTATSVASSIAPAATSALSSTASSATSMMSGVVSGAISAVGSIISGFMVKAAVDGLKRVTENTNTILTQQTERNNIFLPALIGIHERLIEIRQLGIRVWTTHDAPLHMQMAGGLAAGSGLTVEINNSSFIGFRDMDAFIDEIVRRIRQRL